MIDMKDMVALAERAVCPPKILDDPRLGSPVLYVPAVGAHPSEKHDLSGFMTNPPRAKVDESLIDAADFALYVNAYKQPGYTALFASLATNTVTAVMDYHMKEAGNDPQPRWCDHKCTLRLDTDPDWAAWTAGNNKLVDQDAFAAFLDGMYHVIYEPDAATIRDIVLRFTGQSIVKFERPVFDEQSGSVKVNYTNETEQSSSMKLPATIGLRISPFRTAPAQDVAANLRYRFREGGVSFGWEIVRPDRIAEAAFRAVLAKIETETGLHPVLGP